MSKRPAHAKQDRLPRPQRAPDSAPKALDLVSRWSRPACLFSAAALFAMTPLVPGESAAAGGTGVPLVMLWLALLAVWLLAALSHARFPLRFGWADAALLLLVGWQFASGLVMAWSGNPRHTFNMMWQWVGFGAAFLVVRQLVQTAAETRAFHAVMIALAVALAGLGLYQYFYALPLQRAEYERLDESQRTAWIRRAGVEAPPGSRQRVLFENRLRSVEPLSTFALTNSLAGFLAPWLTAALGIFVAHLGAGRTGARTLLALGAAAAFLAGCLVLTKSRTAFLATGLGTALAVASCRPGGRRLPWIVPALAAGAIVLLVLGAIFAGGLDAQVLSQAPQSVLYRVEYWQATSALIAAHSWFGVGPGNFQEYYTSYKLPQASESIADPHNFLFEIWATAGTPALAALLAFLAALGWQLWRAGRNPPGDGSPFAAPPSAEQPGHARAILLGGLAGVVLAFPYSILVGFPLDSIPVVGDLIWFPVVWLVGVPWAVGLAVLLVPWVESGRLPLAVPVAALVVLLVNLLAAGGIGFPGVSNSLWLLAALALNLTPALGERSVPRFGAAALLVAVLSLVFVCHTSAYLPVLSASAELDRGRHLLADEKYEQAENAFAAAARADPYSAAPWEQMALCAFRRWQLGPSPAWLERFDSAVEQMLRRDGQSSSRRMQVGDWYLAAFRRTHERSLIERAVTAYREAVERYPSGSLAYTRLAWACTLARDEESARRAAEEALRLDSLTPHADQKLSAQLTFDPGPFDKLPKGVPDKPAEENLEELMRRVAGARAAGGGA